MIFFKAQGRLGNQIFQYAFLQSKKEKKEKIFSIGFDELLETFEITDVINISKKSKYLVYFINKIVLKFFMIVSISRVIMSYRVLKEKIIGFEVESIKIKQQGFLKSIKFIYPGFFQSDKFFNCDLKLKIKEEFLHAAKCMLSKISSCHKIYFVHLRYGDYIDFKVLGKSTILPIEYYHNLIRKCLNEDPNIYFIFLSDSPNEIVNEFDYLQNKHIFNSNGYKIDFSIMTLCDGAILSPSSFSWWGAFLMKDRKHIYAPENWLGFNSGIDFPSHPTPNFFFKQPIKFKNE